MTYLVRPHLIPDGAIRLGRQLVREEADLYNCDLLHRNESHVAVSYTQKTAVKHVQGEKYQFSLFSGKLLYKV